MDDTTKQLERIAVLDTIFQEGRWHDPQAQEVADEWLWREHEARDILGLRRVVQPSDALRIREHFEALAYAAELVAGYPYSLKADDSAEVAKALEWVKGRREALTAELRAMVRS